MLPILAFLAFNMLSSGASNIYNAIGRFYAWAQMPKGDDGVFFGYAGCTRKVLIYTIECMRNSFAAGWYTENFTTRSGLLKQLAKQVAQETGASEDGVYKWACWVYSACTKDSDILGYLAGGEFTTVDYVKKVVSETASDTAQSVAETVEYGVKYDTGTERTINKLLPVVGIAGACYIAYKIFK